MSAWPDINWAHEQSHLTSHDTAHLHPNLTKLWLLMLRGTEIGRRGVATQSIWGDCLRIPAYTAETSLNYTQEHKLGVVGNYKGSSSVAQLCGFLHRLKNTQWLHNDSELNWMIMYRDGILCDWSLVCDCTCEWKWFLVHCISVWSVVCICFVSCVVHMFVCGGVRVR